MPCPEIDKQINKDTTQPLLYFVCLTVYKTAEESMTFVLEDRKNSNTIATIICKDLMLAKRLYEELTTQIRLDMIYYKKQTPIGISVAANVESLTKETPIA